MGRNIKLSKEYGINPHMIVCARCGGHTGEIALVGDLQKYVCRHCKQVHMGFPDGGRCMKCGGSLEKVGPVTPEDKIVTGAVCDKCAEEIKKEKELMEAGAVPFRCEKCKAMGLIKAEAEIAKKFRAIHPYDPSKPMGLSIPECPNCTPQETETN